MKIRVRLIQLVVFCLLCLPTLAQLRITSPVPRMVFQRSLYDDATLTVAGVAPPAATRVEARFVPLATGQGSVTPWTNLDMLPGSLAFRGQATVSAGWYRLDVQAWAGTALLAQTQVNRVGVGEVFVIAGQSNPYGGFQRVPSAVEDRVSCVDFRQDSLSEQLLPLQFSHVSYGTSIGPSQPPHLWGLLGDKLVQRLNLPVLFLGAALGGTSSQDWQQSAAGNIGTMQNPAVYRRLGAALLHYVARTGARAILWHQGESDLYSSQQTYFDNIRYVIEKSRAQTGFGQLAWMVSRASYISGQTNPNVIAAQNQLIADVPGVFAGPATDDLTGPDNRSDDIHLQGAGLYRFTDRWDQRLDTDFFQNAVPFTPTDESALITSGYTLPLTRRPGETLAVASLRSDPGETDNQYFAQIVRAADGATVYESPRSTDNPLLITIPADLPDGQYRLRTLSTHPSTTGTLGEPFTVRQSASPAALPPVFRLPIGGGTADAALQRFAYRYETGSHGFFAMIQATAAMEVRLQRIDGGDFADSGWNPVPPSSEAPDYTEFADFNYLRNYPPISGGVGGVEPGHYRFSVRRQGDPGDGLWYELRLLNGRNILYYPMETVPAIPPVLTLVYSSANPPCLSGSFEVAIDVTDGVLAGDNTFSIRLSDASGSFADETVVGSGTTSPILVTLPADLPTYSPGAFAPGGSTYRLRAMASNPAVASAPSDPLPFCTTAGNTADLSLSLYTSNRTAHVGQPVTLTLVLTNAGPLSTSNVTVGSRLPDGLAFVDAVSSSVSPTSNGVIINVGTLMAGTQVAYIFRLKPTRSGSFAPAVQITASSRPDPDSQPGSGTGDGQDDAAQIDLRTPDATGPVSNSPNPDQVPLPPVQSNQPPADPNRADLSLALTANGLTVSQNQAVAINLTVSNRGGSAATNVSLQTELPPGWQLIDSVGLSVNGQTVRGTISTLPAGDSTTLTLLVRPGASGTLRAQILSATPDDEDSTPGNGDQNGEDDEAVLTLRVR